MYLTYQVNEDDLAEVGIRRIYVNVYGAYIYTETYTGHIYMYIYTAIHTYTHTHTHTHTYTHTHTHIRTRTRGIRHIYAAARTRSIRMTSLTWAYAAYLLSELVVRLL